MKNYIYNKSIFYRKTESVYLAYDECTGTMYEFNETSGRILELVNENLPISGILEKITSEYAVTQEEVREDILDILDRFNELKIIKYC